jgi:hypothetical protein
MSAAAILPCGEVEVASQHHFYAQRTRAAWQDNGRKNSVPEMSWWLIAAVIVAGALLLLAAWAARL